MLFAFAQVNVLLHAAAIGKARDGSIGTSFENITAWKEVLDVNLGGVRHKYSLYARGPAYGIRNQAVNVVQTFTTHMCSQENPGA